MPYLSERILCTLKLHSFEVILGLNSDCQLERANAGLTLLPYCFAMYSCYHYSNRQPMYVPTPRLLLSNPPWPCKQYDYSLKSSSSALRLHPRISVYDISNAVPHKMCRYGDVIPKEWLRKWQERRTYAYLKTASYRGARLSRMLHLFRTMLRCTKAHRGILRYVNRRR